MLELPDTLVDASQLVRPGCSLDEDQFVLAGRGGLPDSPLELMDGDRPWLDLRNLFDLRNSFDLSNDTIADVTPVEYPSTPEFIQEATGMAIVPNGTLQLVASQAQNATIPHASCTSQPNIL